ncbi:MAG: hypothetical protein LLF92_05410 [Planctomycetaceae bacterium]|nr:hypothetical protein [Planctomycetaceae bacterium]
MDKDINSSDLKKDDISSAPVASNIEKNVIKVPPEELYKMSSCSTNAEISDVLTVQPEVHSEVFNTYVVSARYKITLEQARRMAMNAAKRSQKRHEIFLRENEDSEI